MKISKIQKNIVEKYKGSTPIPSYSKIFNIFTNNFDLVGFTYVLRLWDFKDFSRFHHSALPFLFKTLGDTNCFWPTINLLFNFFILSFQHWPSGSCWKIIIPYYQKSISCFLVDIGTTSKIPEHFLDGSSSFFGARLSEISKTFEIRNSEICKNNISYKWYGI